MWHLVVWHPVCARFGLQLLVQAFPIYLGVGLRPVVLPECQEEMRRPNDCNSQSGKCLKSPPFLVKIQILIEIQFQIESGKQSEKIAMIRNLLSFWVSAFSCGIILGFFSKRWLIWNCGTLEKNFISFHSDPCEICSVIWEARIVISSGGYFWW